MIIGEKVVDSPQRTKMEIHVLDNGPESEVVTQYGMRYPNGVIQWTADEAGHNFQLIAEGERNALESWKGNLHRKAKAASIDPEAYVKDHAPVKRTVILTTTATEEVHRAEDTPTPVAPAR